MQRRIQPEVPLAKWSGLILFMKLTLSPRGGRPSSSAGFSLSAARQACRGVAMQASRRQTPHSIAALVVPGHPAQQLHHQHLRQKAAPGWCLAPHVLQGTALACRRTRTALATSLLRHSAERRVLLGTRTVGQGAQIVDSGSFGQVIESDSGFVDGWTVPGRVDQVVERDRKPSPSPSRCCKLRWRLGTQPCYGAPQHMRGGCTDDLCHGRIETGYFCWRKWRGEGGSLGNAPLGGRAEGYERLAAASSSAAVPGCASHTQKTKNSQQLQLSLSVAAGVGAESA